MQIVGGGIALVWIGSLSERGDGKRLFGLLGSGTVVADSGLGRSDAIVRLYGYYELGDFLHYPRMSMQRTCHMHAHSAHCVEIHNSRDTLTRILAHF